MFPKTVILEIIKYKFVCVKTIVEQVVEYKDYKNIKNLKRELEATLQVTNIIYSCLNDWINLSIKLSECIDFSLIREDIYKRSSIV